jgi:hypothetical protein
LTRIGSVLYRGSYMADGEAVKVFEDHGLVDADPKHRATLGAVIDHLPIPLQVDYILYPKAYRVSNFVLQKMPARLSDHHAIIATVET